MFIHIYLLHPLVTVRKLRTLIAAYPIYGANASGKSKLVEALGFMRHFILRSSGGTQLNDKIPTVPFRLNPNPEQAPSEFELTFLHEDELFCYGFEVTTEKVMAEWLYHRPKTKEIEVFYRDEQTLGGPASPMLRRDQIWFVSKDRYGASSLYPLSNFKTDTVRKNDDYREKYLQGRFGAIPFLNTYEETLSQWLQPARSNE